MDHLHPDIESLLSVLTTGSLLAGALSNKDLGFDEIVSLVKTLKPPRPDRNKISYYVFDIDLRRTPYNDRYNTLVKAYKTCIDMGYEFKHLVIVRSFLANSEEEICKYMDVFVDIGYEGIMIKKIGCKDLTDIELSRTFYIHGRTSNILKHKNVQDEEGTIVGVTEAKGTEKKCAIFLCRDPRGNSLSIRMKGSFEARKKWLEDADNLIGKKITYTFQELSKDGVARFPVGKCIRDYE